MKRIKVKELMISLADFATVDEEATLFEVVQALKQAHEQYTKSPFRHRAVLVFNKEGKLTGRIRLWDVLQGLEPGYQEITHLEHTSGLGFSAEFMRDTLESAGLWQRPLDDISRKAVDIKAKDVMHVPPKDEYISEDDSLDHAIHHLVMGRFPSLIVTRGEKVVGILRVADVYDEIGKAMETCHL
ncbi:MAG: CBS domain-containing protein [Deltaproteobacteria bacterium]|nr:CBS domain-containing protein [Deltaproteobacteria bacterium]